MTTLFYWLNGIACCLIPLGLVVLTFGVAHVRGAQ
jgi:hypothetical protein